MKTVLVLKTMVITALAYGSWLITQSELMTASNQIWHSKGKTVPLSQFWTFMQKWHSITIYLDCGSKILSLRYLRTYDEQNTLHLN